MTEPRDSATSVPSQGDPAQAGALMRAAREKQGLRLEALATLIKVLPVKLEALEAGRIEQLPDATFARALAQAVCRALKIDAAPVLALMPGNRQSRLERVDEGLNTPFREHSGRLMDAQDWLPWQRPVPWLVAVLLLAAAAFLLLPRSTGLDDAGATQPMPPADAAASAVLPDSAGQAAEPASAAAASAAATPVLAVETAALAATTPMPTQASPVAESSAAAAAMADALSVRGLQSTWVQVSDAKGRSLLSRTVAQGETAVVDGVLPLKVRIGNVAGTELGFRGKTVDLGPANRNNMASLSLP